MGINSSFYNVSSSLNPFTVIKPNSKSQKYNMPDYAIILNHMMQSSISPLKITS